MSHVTVLWIRTQLIIVHARQGGVGIRVLDWGLVAYGWEKKNWTPFFDLSESVRFSPQIKELRCPEGWNAVTNSYHVPLFSPFLPYSKNYDHSLLSIFNPSAFLFCDGCYLNLFTYPFL